MYKAGGFLFPTVTGAYSVTGLGFRPKAVILCGTNSPTMESLETWTPGTYPGMFVSFSGLDYLDGVTIRTLGVCVAGASLSNVANEWAGQYPVRMGAQSSMSTIDYKADSITFDDDGFTLNVTNAATGNRWVHWFAIGEVDLGTLLGFSLSGSWDMGFLPKSCVVLCTTSQSAYVDTVYNGNEAWFSMGAGSFVQRGSPSLDWTTILAYSGVIFSTPSIGRQGFTWDVVNFGNSESVHVGVLVLLDDIATFQPTAIGSTVLAGGPGFQGYDNVIAWDADSACNFVTFPAAGDVSHVGVPPEFDKVDAALFIASNDPDSGLNTNHNLSYMFGMLTDDYQGCVGFSKRGELFQSAELCAATFDNGSLNTAEGDLITPPSGFDLHGIAGGGATIQAIWFGGSAGWFPQMYRWWSSGKKLAAST